MKKAMVFYMVPFLLYYVEGDGTRFDLYLRGVVVYRNCVSIHQTVFGRIRSSVL